MTPGTRTGRVSFIGAGPGAADLITLRGARRIAEADIVVWAASLVTPECVREHARSDAELVDSSRLTHEEAVEIYRRAEREWLNVARVHSGDPSLWGAVQEQHDVCSRMELEVEIVPGVAAFSAAAASVGRELTVPEVAQSVVLTRLEGGKTPMPSGEKVREFAKHGTTMALFLSAARTGQLVEELRAGGYEDDIPVVIAYKVTWPDELILRTTLGELESTVKRHKLWRHTLFLIGHALNQGGTRSHLYNPGHFHTFRKADPQARKALRARRSNGSRSSYRARSAETVEQMPAGEDQSESPGADDRRVTNRPDSDVAWWAVRDWQQSAREGNRTSARADGKVPTSAGPSAGRGEPDLFSESNAAESPESEAAPAPVDAESTPEATGIAESVSAGADDPAAQGESSVEPTAGEETDTGVSLQVTSGEQRSDETESQAVSSSESAGKGAAKSTSKQTSSKSGQKTTAAKSSGKSGGSKSGSKTKSAQATTNTETRDSQ